MQDEADSQVEYLDQKHLDRARRDAIAALHGFMLAHRDVIARTVLLDDLYGRVSAVLWLTDPAERERLEADLQRLMSEAAGVFWTRRVFFHGPETTHADKAVFNRIWEEGTRLGGAPKEDRFRVSDQGRSLRAWMRPVVLSNSRGNVVVFYSFKGGLGRTTALASFALSRSRMSERVVVIDFDLDSPGVGVLLSADEQGTIAPWGIVDYLLERSVLKKVPLSDYYHRVVRTSLTGAGVIDVFPAGQINEDYLPKLSRLDLEPPDHGSHPLEGLLTEIQENLAPSWILIDVRAGLSPAAGLLLSGYAALHVLVGTNSEQSWQGLRPILQRLGGQRVQRGLPQSRVLMVQGMVPEHPQVAGRAKEEFAARAEEEFSREYYAEAPEEPDSDSDLLTVNDIHGSDAPHVPVPLRYHSPLAFFRDLTEVSEDLVSLPDYVQLAERLVERVPGAAEGERS